MDIDCRSQWLWKIYSGKIDDWNTKPLTGDIYYNHQCINPEHLSELRNHIGIVFQNPENQFVGATVEYDVAFGLENNAISHESMHEIVPKVLSDVDMLDRLNYEPQSLSGGQKQRVAILWCISA